MPVGKRLLLPCGTRAGWDRHKRHGEHPCESCVDAKHDYDRRYQLDPETKSAYDKARYPAARAAKIASAVKWHFTHQSDKAAYDLHRRPVKNARRRADYATDPEKYTAPMKVHQRRNTLKAYGLSEADFEAKFEAQGRRCACCGATESGGNNWCVDHDHTTQKVRGILCIRCNTGIGMLGDNLAGVSKAVLYLSPEPPPVTEQLHIEEHW